MGGGPLPVSAMWKPAGSWPGWARPSATVTCCCANPLCAAAAPAVASNNPLRYMVAPPGLAFGHVYLVERGANAVREFHRIIVWPEMHEDRARLVVQHVIVQGSHLYAGIAQRGHDRRDFPCLEHEVTGDRRLARTCGLEIDRCGCAHAGRNAHTGVGDRVGP